MEDHSRKMRLSQKLSSSPDQAIVFSSKLPNHKPSNNNDSEQIKDHNGRERLKRHREEEAGRVVVPDRWGKEDLMKDWIDHSSFDKLLAPKGLRSAREALILESQRRHQLTASSASPQRFMRIESMY